MVGTTQLVYASRARSAVSLSELQQINATAVERNTANGITGMLLYGAGSFLQVLEGDRANVNRTYHRICQDARHVDPTLLFVAEIREREFSRWAMRFTMLDQACGAETKALLAKLGEHANFTPLELSASTAFVLLRAVARAHANQ